MLERMLNASDFMNASNRSATAELMSSLLKSSHLRNGELTSKSVQPGSMRHKGDVRCKHIQAVLGVRGGEHCLSAGSLHDGDPGGYVPEHYILFQIHVGRSSRDVH